MSVVIVNEGLNGEPPAGRYLERYDPDWVPEGARPPYRMTGRAWWTDDLDRAQRFPSAAEAIAEWKRQSRLLPMRPWDGRPNRPLTAFTVSFQTVTP